MLPFAFATRQPRHLFGATAAIMVLLSTLLTPAASAQAAPARCEIIGTEGNDVLVGTEGDDVICGLGGNDVIRGLGGDDELLGGAGWDELIGGPGNDLLRGDSGHDSLLGGPGDDELRGGDGEDVLAGGDGSDELRGGNNDDTIAGGDGDDELRGGNGDDRLRGANGEDLIFGGPGNDIIRGGSGNDRLRGGPDADICLDSFVKTGAINCEFGRGGDDREIAVAQQLWTLFGNHEFVYAMTITQPCPETATCGVSAFAETVHVRGPWAQSSFGAPAFTAEELFAEADRAVSAGRKVTFDSSFGLPRLIDTAEGATLGVDEVEFRDDIRSAFESATAAWDAAEVDEYAYTVNTSCFCPFTGPLRVTVTNGTEVTAEPLGDGVRVWTGGVKTIGDHLNDLGDLLDGTAIHVSAEFDPVYGIPSIVSVDESRAIADEERTVQITDFVPVLPELETPEEDTPPPEPEPEPQPDEPVEDEPEPAPGMPELSIVSVRGIQVASEIATQVEALLAAAEADGFAFSGGGFRDPQRQIELRKANCGTSDYAIYEMPASQCSPPTAKPGQSQHELGLAIDFTNSGRLITSRNDLGFVWLAEHAPAFGFINLPSEPWHWSTTGN